jgi:hypothetical protein
VIYGLCCGPDARVLFLDTIEEVIFPGLEADGFPAARAWQNSHRQPLAA